jgi:mono/diheme cytochrome c family protein
MGLEVAVAWLKGRAVVAVVVVASTASTYLASGLLYGQDDPVAAEVKANGDHQRGEKLYNRYCRGCHGEEGKGDGLTFQPHIDNLTKKGYIEKLPDSYLLLAITKGGEGIGKSNAMPSWEGTLSQQQMFDIIAYIRSLPLN